MRDVLRLILEDSISSPLRELTRRDVALPRVPGKVQAIIGMRRAGKTCFLQQCMAERLAAGHPRDSMVYVSFDDERLTGMEAAQLHWVLEEYYRLCPKHRDSRRVMFCFDEIQVVPGWETFIRRVVDSEKVDIFLSGSSAKMLSREVATSLRGRAMESVVHPFSFREHLRHLDDEPAPDKPFGKAQRSRLERAFASYLKTGGFPEAQSVPTAEQVSLLQGYVDTVILRDVMERHGVTNLTALRQLTRQLLSAPAGLFSMHRFFNEQKSRGVAVSKDALHAMLGYLEDAFLVRLLPIHTSSERQRQSNPRKGYPVDPGLIHAYDRTGRANTGHALETAVMIELERRRHTLAYVKTTEGYEVDFMASPLTGKPQLIQVCADISNPETLHREFRALEAAMKEQRGLKGCLLTLDSTGILQASAAAPRNVTVLPAWEWMLATHSD